MAIAETSTSAIKVVGVDEAIFFNPSKKRILPGKSLSNSLNP